MTLLIVTSSTNSTSQTQTLGLQSATPLPIAEIL